MLTVYGYVLKHFRDGQGQESAKYREVFENFYDKKVKKHFDFDRDELHTHYRDESRYPFEKIFQAEREDL